MKSNYLKYWKAVRYYFKMKYGLSQEELDILLYVYDLGYFSTKKLDKLEKLFSWDKDRITKMCTNGWLGAFDSPTKKDRKIYEISPKGKRVITHMYNILNREAGPYIEKGQNLSDLPYMERRYTRFLIAMMEEIEQEKERKKLEDQRTATTSRS